MVGTCAALFVSAERCVQVELCAAECVQLVVTSYSCCIADREQVWFLGPVSWRPTTVK